MPSWLSAIGAFFGFGQAVAEDIGKAQDAKRDNVNRDLGAIAQKDKTNEDELQTLRDDRQRDASVELRDRTAADHGISRDAERIL